MSSLLNDKQEINSDKESLTFFFELPVRSVRKEFPSAQFILRTSMFTDVSSPPQNAAISINEKPEWETVVNRRNSNKNLTQDFPLKEVNKNK